MPAGGGGQDDWGEGEWPTLREESCEEGDTKDKQGISKHPADLDYS